MKRTGSTGNLKRLRTKRTALPKRSKKKKRHMRTTRKEIAVRRSSGRTEKLDINRMAQTVSRSGVPFMMARDIAKNVTRKIKSEVPTDRRKRVTKKTITAGRVRGMVAKELRDRNRPDIASSYSGQMPENTRQERFEMTNENEPVLDRVAAHKDSVLHDRSKRLSAAS